MRDDKFGDDVGEFGEDPSVKLRDEGLYGVRSSDLGSSFPEATYRPVPIVWFAAAYIIQSLVLLLIFGLFFQSGVMMIGLSAMATLAIGAKTFRNKMQHAGKAWRIATILMLLTNLSFVVLGVVSV